MASRDRGRARPAVWAGALALIGSAGIATPAWGATGHGHNPPTQPRAGDHDGGSPGGNGQPSPGPQSSSEPQSSSTQRPPAGSAAGQGQGDAGRNGGPGSSTGQGDGGAATTSPTGEAGPPGNNGHIQIDEFNPDGGRGNDPHVTCGLSVSFFGFDGGFQTASITVTPWAPTGGGTPYRTTYQLTNQTRTSGDQPDGTDSIAWSALAGSFAGITPAHQGYHARVEVAVPYSNGSDTKTHMVWIRPCTAPGAAAAVQSSPAGVAAPTQSPTTAALPGVRAALCTAMASVNVSTLPAGAAPYFEAVESVLCSAATPVASPVSGNQASAEGRPAPTASVAGASVTGASVLGMSVSPASKPEALTTLAAPATQTGLQAQSVTATPVTVTAESLVARIAGAQSAGVSPAVEAARLVAAATPATPTLASAPVPAPRATAGGSSLPFTGADVAAEAAVGAALLGGGMAVRRATRRRRRR